MKRHGNKQWLATDLLSCTPLSLQRRRALSGLHPSRHTRSPNSAIQIYLQAAALNLPFRFGPAVAELCGADTSIRDVCLVCRPRAPVN
jgi:hypothetical protein